MSADGSPEGLKTIENGHVPECRMKDATAVQGFVRRLIEQDGQGRSQKRAQVDGLVDGNAPYQASKLAAAGRREACNVNWGTGRSYLESGSGAFYDLFSESPGFVLIETGHGREDQRVEWSRTMSTKADEVFMAAEEFDSEMQLSQNEMVLHGNGPLFFENEFKVFPRSIETGSLLVPERTSSNIQRWEAAAVLIEYYPPELYEFIQNAKAAKAVGWDVEFTRRTIESAMDFKQDGQSYNWEDYQRQLKSNSLSYYDDSKVIHAAHVFWKEFSGRITHAIVQREDSTGKGTKYLFLKVGRYSNFTEAIHPMYFDRGRGGYHHSVTGLGVKMFGPMAYENRLLCNLMDKAFAPKTLFKPTTTEATQKFQLATYGDWGLLPPGTEVVQNPIQGMLNDGLAMFRTSSELMRSNLSSYRQNVAMEKPGNPNTAFKERLDASQQSALSNTTFSRYYRQLDSSYFEIVRRLCNPNSTDEIAKDYQKSCIAAGVPRECFGRIKSVRAVRVIGQGSPFMRQQVTTEMTAVINRCSEEGQNNWLNDFIASRAGQSAVSRYNPRPKVNQLATEQMERAGNQLVGMRSGKPATITASQDALVFATEFLKASVQAVQSVQQGANPQQVLAFLSLSGAAIAAHIQRMAKDPLRKQVVAELTKQWKQLAGVTDKLKALVQKQAQKQKEQQARTQAAMTDEQLAAAKLQGEEARKNAKLKQAMAIKDVTTRQNLSIADAKTASEIKLSHAREAGKPKPSSGGEE